MATLRVLPDHLVNQIAAGEVIERPSAALKEIIENALDARATQIDVTLREGGKSYLSVTDNGLGMSPEDLSLAITRHATSKLPSDDLVHIQSLGFRGEALPSIGAVGRLSITSREKNADTAWTICVEGGKVTPPVPAAHPPGTRVVVRDLFFATPARLKFLKADVTEYAACKDVIIRLALSHPSVGFSLTHNDQKILTWPAATIPDPETALAARVHSALGADFHDNTVPLLAEDGGTTIQGRIGYPSYNKAQANHQYLFVNGRAVRDRALMGALRAAFGDLVPHDRHGVALLFLTLPPEMVDVNVHPGKAEVRFRDSQRLRGLLIGAIRHRLASLSSTAQSLETHLVDRLAVSGRTSFAAAPSYRSASPSHLFDRATAFYQPLLAAPPSYRPTNNTGDTATDTPLHHDDITHPLGIARAHVHNTYIVAQSADGVVLVDAHAAHERLTYERYKSQLATNGLPAQQLLTPFMVTMDDVRAAHVLAHTADLAQFGLGIDSFGPDCVLIRTVPADLADRIDWPRLINDLADQILAGGSPSALEDRLLSYLATRACHHAIRAGRPLSADEMNALLRQIEDTPNATQCNHGRPVFIKLSLTDLERLFERR